jgi:hypothetical protein
MRMKIKEDVSLRIFEEVNKNNDTLKHIDLSCLDYEDAIKISKKMLKELAN